MSESNLHVSQDEGIGIWQSRETFSEEAARRQISRPHLCHPSSCKVESIDPEGIACWFIDTLNSDTSRPFQKPTNGRIAVKVINCHLGAELMKVFRT